MSSTATPAVVGTLLAACCADVPAVDPCQEVPSPLTLVDESAALMASDPLPNDVAIDESHIFWVDYFAGMIRRASKDGEDVITLGTTRLPQRLTIDADNVYWIAGDGAVGQVGRNGGPAIEIAPPTVDEAGHAVATDSANIYWIEGSRLMKRSKLGTPAVELTANAFGVGHGSLVQDRDNIYFASVDRGRYAIRRIPKDGGPSQILATFDLPFYIGGDQQNVFAAGLHGLWRVPMEGPGFTLLYSGELRVRSLVSDGTHLYLSNGGRILRLPADGGAPTLIACTQSALHVAVDATHVYWNDEHASSIMSAPKF
jgi:hypothetical protein